MQPTVEINEVMELAQSTKWGEQRVPVPITEASTAYMVGIKCWRCSWVATLYSVVVVPTSIRTNPLLQILKVPSAMRFRPSGPFPSIAAGIFFNSAGELNANALLVTSRTFVEPSGNTVRSSKT